jgi:hypothetical protein
VGAFDRYVEDVHAFADSMRAGGRSYRQFDRSETVGDLLVSIEKKARDEKAARADGAG